MNKQILDILNSKEIISGHTHKFYNYPARFHPKIARALIENFTQIGDCVIDPFMGSGTTGIEALSCGRKFLGIDNNPLATFLARVKTTPLTPRDINSIKRWASEAPNLVNLNGRVILAKKWSPYIKNMPWWIWKTVAILLQKMNELESDRQKDFVRCGILSAGQWALDSKKLIPSKRAFIITLQNKLRYMLNELLSYQEHIKRNIDVPLSQISRRRKLLCRPIAGVEKDQRIIRNWVPAKLILTSPPYPGIHVVYNRWQVKGRKETPAPYWIINNPNGYGLSYYTLGDRKQEGLTNYFYNLSASFASIKQFMDKKSTIVQLVGFANPKWQLKKYLEIMNELGFREEKFSRNFTKRYYRYVPNRKWFTQYQNSSYPSEKEFLLIHKLS